MWAHHHRQVWAGASSSQPAQCPRLIAECRGSRKQRRPSLLTQASPKPDQLLVGALEKVLERISRLLQQEERKRQKAGGQPSEPLPKKKISFSAHARGRKDIQEPPSGPIQGRGLEQYISLPITQYSLLDPRWITRPSGEEDLFLLSVPLYDLASINLNPQVYIKVDVDSEHRKVHFNADRFTVGDPRFDEGFELGMTASLQYHPPGKKGGLALLGSLIPQRRSSTVPTQLQGTGSNGSSSSSSNEPSEAGAPDQGSAREADNGGGATSSPSTALQGGVQSTLTTSTTTVVASSSHGLDSSSSSASSNGNGVVSSDGTSNVSTTTLATTTIATSGSPPDDSLAPSAGKLDLDVKLECRLLVPHPLAAIPGPMLSLAGSLIARLMIQSLIPSFLDLLKVDYQRWATGQGSRSEAAGSLVTRSPSTSSSPTLELSVDSDLEEEGSDKDGAETSAAVGATGSGKLPEESQVATGHTAGEAAEAPQPLSSIIGHHSSSNGHVSKEAAASNIATPVGTASDSTGAR